METWKHLLLIADDDHLLHRALDRYAREAGLEVAHAMTGGEVVPLALRRRPSAILLDLGLPDRDGVDVLAQMKATPELSDIPVIVFSARTEQEQRLFALELGAENYVEKPFDAQRLISRIIRAIDKRSDPSLVSGKASGRFAMGGPVRTLPQGDSTQLAIPRRIGGETKK